MRRREVWVIQQFYRTNAPIAFPYLIAFLGSRRAGKLHKPEQFQWVRPRISDIASEVENLLVFAKVCDNFRLGFYGFVSRVFFVEKNAVDFYRPEMSYGPLISRCHGRPQLCLLQPLRGMVF